MARSPEDLANAALAYLVRDTIRSLDGTSPGAIQTKQHMQNAIEEVIEEWDWPECRVTGLLTEVSGVDSNHWSTAYAVPADLVKVWYVGNQDNKTTVPYERGMSTDVSDNRSYFFSDLNPCYIRYGSRRVTIDRFSAQVFDLMALMLALKICMVLTKDMKIHNYLTGLYTKRLSKVKTLVANAEPELEDVDFTPETILVRSE